MERPTKPVMWTDEEVSSRFKNWLYAQTDEWQTEDGFIYHHKTNDFRDFKIQNNKYGNNHDLRLSLGLPSKLLNVTTDSLLHEINVICPIGRLEYESKWIDKILSGQKTMDILPTQHACGYYELWDTDRQEVRGIVEITNAQKLSDMDSLMRNDITSSVNRRKVYNCGFDSVESFIAHHRTHFQSVKYAITYQVVDMKGGDNA